MWEQQHGGNVLMPTAWSFDAHLPDCRFGTCASGSVTANTHYGVDMRGASRLSRVRVPTTLLERASCRRHHSSWTAPRFCAWPRVDATHCQRQAHSSVRHRIAPLIDARCTRVELLDRIGATETERPSDGASGGASGEGVASAHTILSHTFQSYA